MSSFKFGEWVDPKKCLPVSEELVIVSIKDDRGDHVVKHTSFGWRTSYMVNENAWIVDNEVRTDIEAWMPLPEPYKD